MGDAATTTTPKEKERPQSVLLVRFDRRVVAPKTHHRKKEPMEIGRCRATATDGPDGRPKPRQKQNAQQHQRKSRETTTTTSEFLEKDTPHAKAEAMLQEAAVRPLTFFAVAAGEFQQQQQQ